MSNLIMARNRKIIKYWSLTLTTLLVKISFFSNNFYTFSTFDTACRIFRCRVWKDLAECRELNPVVQYRAHSVQQETHPITTYRPIRLILIKFTTYCPIRLILIKLPHTVQSG